MQVVIDLSRICLKALRFDLWLEDISIRPSSSYHSLDFKEVANHMDFHSEFRPIWMVYSRYLMDSLDSHRFLQNFLEDLPGSFLESLVLDQLLEYEAGVCVCAILCRIVILLPTFPKEILDLFRYPGRWNDRRDIWSDTDEKWRTNVNENSYTTPIIAVRMAKRFYPYHIYKQSPNSII